MAFKPVIMMTVAIIGSGNAGREALRSVIEANQKLGCEVIIIDGHDDFRLNDETPVSVDSLNMVKKLLPDLPRPKSKYHK